MRKNLNCLSTYETAFTLSRARSPSKVDAREVVAFYNDVCVVTSRCDDREAHRVDDVEAFVEHFLKFARERSGSSASPPSPARAIGPP